MPKVNHSNTRCCICGSSESYIKYIDSNTKKPVYLWYKKYEEDGSWLNNAYMCNKCWNKESPNSFDNIQKSLRNKRIREFKGAVYDNELINRLQKEYNRKITLGLITKLAKKDGFDNIRDWQNWKRKGKKNKNIEEHIKMLFEDKITDENRWDIYNFWSRVDINENNQECWNWTEGTTIGGYGNFIYHGDNIKAHRMTYILAKGPIPDGLQVQHLCNNPMCCNPNHLELGDELKNSQYKYQCDRQNMTLTKDRVREILKVHIDHPELTQSQIAEMFRISQGMISMIINGMCWHNIYEEFI